MDKIEELLNLGKELVKSGDLDLQMYRGWFKQTYDREVSLTEEELIVALMSAEDDMEPEEWVQLLIDAEKAKLEA